MSEGSLPQRPHILGHRGAMALFPENTLLSLEGALQGPHRADGVEFDVRLSADHVPVLFHDSTTDRVTGAPGTVEGRTHLELQELSVHGQPIPSLRDALGRLEEIARSQGRGLLINIEVKPTGAPGSLIGALGPVVAPYLDHSPLALVFSSFDPRVLSELSPSLCRALLYEDTTALGFLGALEAKGAPLDLHPRHDLLNPEHVSMLGGRTVRTWTVDDPQVARACASLGVDTIISNDPGALIANLEEALS